MARTDVSQDQLRKIKAIALDVDGVLTDGGMWWGANGEEFKRFCFSDIMGLSLARRKGLIIALISGENSPLIDRYAAKMKIVNVVKGCRDKASALGDFATRNGLQLDEICFMGDDVNDLAAMKMCGLSATPADAQPVALKAAGFVTTCAGGRGAVRELVDALFAAHETDSETVYTNSV